VKSFLSGANDHVSCHGDNDVPHDMLENGSPIIAREVVEKPSP
jgi:hypothetical protein